MSRLLVGFLFVANKNGFPNFLFSVKLESQGRGPRGGAGGGGGGGVGAKQMGVGGWRRRGGPWGVLGGQDMS